MFPPAAANDFSWCLLNDSWDSSIAGVYGNKSANLMRLAANGFPVPPGVCFSSAALAAAPAARDELTRALSAIPGPWAVRSSSLAEDAHHRAFPGIYHTVLGVESLDGAVQALSRVGVVPGAELLRAYSPDDPAPTRIPALIQAIFTPRAAGVVFTKNPITLSDSLLINACWGLGKPVVDGTITPDEYEVDRAGAVLSGIVGAKEPAIDSLGRPLEMPPDQSRKACLSPAALGSLVRTAIEVEQLMGAPQDIEWVQDRQDVFWLVQARPITTLQEILS
jgi:pyruvate,water dikinase